jgi:ribonuclease HI
MNIVVYTDGACINNGKINAKAGYGVFFGDMDSRNKSVPILSGKITNQVAELMAIIEAIEIILLENNNPTIIIKSDSRYCIDCATKWGCKWEKNGWKNSSGKIIENYDLVTKLYNYTKKYNIKYEHILSHKYEPDKHDPKYNDWYGNMMADKLATGAIAII